MQQHGFGDAEVSHRALFEEYVSSHVTVCPEPGPCRDEKLLTRAAQRLLLQPRPEPKDSGTLTRLYPLVTERITRLSELVRATELLETLCLNLYLQPWRREIRSLKTFTGAFVYFLVPALSTKTLQSILATIGYLPHKSGPSPSEYRLCEEASPERALHVAFELVLTRALCLHLLQQDQPTVKEWVETTKKQLLPAELPQLSENTDDTEGEDHDPEQDPAPEASPEEPGLTEDQSIFPLHVTYPDLVFRGRPLLPDQDCPALQHAPLPTPPQNAPPLPPPLQHAPPLTPPPQHAPPLTPPPQHALPLTPPHAPLPPHRRHAQRLRVPPTSRPNKDHTEDEGLSGPVGLSLHITLRPQIRGLPPDLDGLGVNSSSVRSDPEEAQSSDKPEERLVTMDTDQFPQDGPGSDSEDDSL